MKLLDKIWIRFFGKFVAKDEFGNEYYESISKNYLGKKTRSVVYSHKAEPSKVPPQFHAWLHYLCNEITPHAQSNYVWQKAHEANMTGTGLAYSPVKGLRRAGVSSDYQSWQPKN